MSSRNLDSKLIRFRPKEGIFDIIFFFNKEWTIIFQGNIRIQIFNIQIFMYSKFMYSISLLNDFKIYESTIVKFNYYIAIIKMN